jgi:hypothetical protein
VSLPLIVAAYSLLFLLLFSLALFLFIVVRRIIVENRTETFERHYEDIEKSILEVISSLRLELANEVAQKYKAYPDILVKVLLEYANIITGQARELLQVIFNQALREKCLRDLSSKRMVRRLRVIRLFVLFSNPSEYAYLLGLLQDKPIVKLTAISALAQVPTPETLSYIFQAFEQDSGPLVRLYFNIMFGLGNKIEFLIRQYLKRPLSEEKVGLLIELVGAIRLRSLYEDIVVFAGHPDKEIRIRVARALGRLLLPESVQALTALSADQAWEVKAQAVKGLGNLKKPETLGLITEALFSTSWHVRLNAGHALADMGEDGIKRLKEVAAQNMDRYARDMANMVLNDLIYSREAA